MDIDFESHVADNDDIESELDPSELFMDSILDKKVIQNHSGHNELFTLSNGKTTTSNLPGNH